jgi:hypothetical protein
MKIPFKAKYTPEGTYVLESSHYPNDRMALVLRSDDGEPQAVLTLNIPNVVLQPDEVIVKDYSENEGTLQALIRANIVQPAHRHVASGFVVHPICLLTEFAKKELQETAS